MQCHCLMGVFPEISRVWLAIDSNIYVWAFEHGSDVAYFDGLGETIVSVGLVKPKPGVFQNFVKYLLVLTTTVEIVVLGKLKSLECCTIWCIWHPCYFFHISKYCMDVLENYI